MSTNREHPPSSARRQRGRAARARLMRAAGLAVSVFGGVMAFVAAPRADAQHATPMTSASRDDANDAHAYERARAYLDHNRIAEARALAERLLAQPETAAVHNLLGNIEERSDRLLEATREYQRAAEMDPTEPHVFDLGQNLLHLHGYEQAAQIFGYGVERYPRSARLRVGLGIAEYSRGHYDAAIDIFAAAADLDPRDSRPYTFLGEMYGVSPAKADVIAQRFADLIRRQPRNAQAHYYYAMSLWKGGADAEAHPSRDPSLVESLLRAAVRLDPHFARAFFQLGALYAQQDRTTEAIAALRKVIANDPALPEGHYRLSRAYHRAGREALARRELAIFTRLKQDAASQQR